MPIEQVVPKDKTVIETQTGEKPVIKIEPPQKVYETNRTIVKERRYIWYAWLVLEIALFLRFILLLFGANPWNFFRVFIELITFPFMIPFLNAFTPTVFGGGDNQIEWSALFAMFVYLLLVFIASRFFKLRKPVGPVEAQQKVSGVV